MPSERATKFVDFIVKTALDSSGCRADLRTGLGRPVDSAPRVHGYLVRFTRSADPHAKAVLYTVASLIAVNLDGAIPRHSPGSLGVSIGKAHRIAENTREKTVHWLTRQPTGQLCRALTHTILPLRQKNADRVDIDFARLVDDATNWPTKRQSIGSRWLQDYYRTLLRVDDATTV